MRRSTNTSSRLPPGATSPASSPAQATTTGTLRRTDPVHRQAARRDDPGTPDRRGAGFPAAAPDAGRSGGDHGRRRRDRRADREHPRRPRPRPPDRGPIRPLARQDPFRRPRPVLLLPHRRFDADRPAPRADVRARRAHHPHRRGRLDPDGGPRRMALRRLVRPRADGLLGPWVLDPRLRARLPPYMARLAQARLAAGAGLLETVGRLLAVPRAPDPPRDHALGDLHPADR